MAKFDTKRIRAGYNSKEHNYAVNVPIYQTAAFDLDTINRAEAIWTLEEDSPIYTRVGNPTVSVLEQRIAELDGAYASLALSSGMAAIAYTILALTEKGGNIVASNALYGGSEDSFSHFFPRFGGNIKFVEDRFDIAAYEKAIDRNTRGIFIETISNPNAELYDIEALAALAHRYHIPLIVDNTVATPYLFNPIEHGADIVVYSATKAIGGHGNTIAGLILESGNFEYSRDKFAQFYEPSYKIKDKYGNRRSPYEIDSRSPLIIHLKAFYLEFIGAALSPFDAFLVLQGLDTISERVQKQTDNALSLVRYLENNKYVEWVSHPLAKKSRFAELAEKYFPKGAGAILSFGFKGTEEQLNSFFSHLNYFSYHVNIGDVRSLITNVSKTTHAELDEKHLKRADIPINTVRISAGIESSEDLIKDLDEAFEFVFRNDDIEFTDAAAKDIDEIAELERISFSKGEGASREAFEYRLKEYPQWFVTARHNGKIIGIINGASSRRDFITDDVYESGGDFDESGKSLLLFGLAVHPDYQHRGIAHELMKRILLKAKEQNKVRAVLTCHEERIPFYEELGYRNCGKSKSEKGNQNHYDMEITL